ncbi:putative short-chain dehydrogenase/reductase SDR, NAD(P)-binding domain superfamily [Septoria linicola]|nr:putative short-chain dehydrogenase/reductase SDR, NAD(P)-binding domain superfamily [Septoria linicola]
MAPVLVVFGCGPGIGIATARLFAQKHFSKIVLLARSAQRLEQEKRQVEEAAQEIGREVGVTALPTDLANFDHLRASLQAIEKLGEISTVFFNAARIKPSDVLTTTVEEIEEDYRVSTLALYITAQWALPKLLEASRPRPSFIVTSSHLPEQPLPFLLSLSATKASQQNVVHALKIAFGERIHIGCVKIAGSVSVQEKNLNPNNIAKEIVQFYEREEEQWGADLVLEP